ncbi:MAG: hypothetical protein R3300_10095 [Candidatus Promineifilaceae bacterium]|nr:hypothetical protein [Candidatus Promineifilaceae bacterium]
MNLTRRQEQFLRNLLDLYHEIREPAHYSLLAERLGVSRFTAYDMLRLLEEKGLAASVYRVSEERSGPGRSEVLFQPTAKAHRLLDLLAGEVDADNWALVKERVLQRTRGGELADPELAQAILARIPPDEPEIIRYCIEVMIIVTLRLQATEHWESIVAYAQRFSPGSSACRVNLSLLSGFVLGLLAGRLPAERLWEQELFTHLLRYQELVIDMDQSMCQRLEDSLHASLASLTVDDKK